MRIDALPVYVNVDCAPAINHCFYDMTTPKTWMQQYSVSPLNWILFSLGKGLNSFTYRHKIPALNNSLAFIDVKGRGLCDERLREQDHDVPMPRKSKF